MAKIQRMSALIMSSKADTAAPNDDTSTDASIEDPEHAVVEDEGNEMPIETSVLAPEESPTVEASRSPTWCQKVLFDPEGHVHGSTRVLIPSSRMILKPLRFGWQRPKPKDSSAPAEKNTQVAQAKSLSAHGRCQVEKQPVTKELTSGLDAAAEKCDEKSKGAIEMAKGRKKSKRRRTETPTTGQSVVAGEHTTESNVCVCAHIHRSSQPMMPMATQEKPRTRTKRAKKTRGGESTVTVQSPPAQGQ